jgi:hypothetical protein
MVIHTNVVKIMGIIKTKPMKMVTMMMRVMMTLMKKKLIEVLMPIQPMVMLVLNLAVINVYWFGRVLFPREPLQVSNSR